MKEQVNDCGTKWEHGNVVNLFSYIMGHRGDGNGGPNNLFILTKCTERGAYELRRRENRKSGQGDLHCLRKVFPSDILPKISLYLTLPSARAEGTSHRAELMFLISSSLCIQMAVPVVLGKKQ